MATKPELAINTSLKNMGGFVKLMLGALADLGKVTYSQIRRYEAFR